jgi:hypothetical protein
MSIHSQGEMSARGPTRHLLPVASCDCFYRMEMLLESALAALGRAIAAVPWAFFCVPLLIMLALACVPHPSASHATLACFTMECVGVRGRARGVRHHHRHGRTGVRAAGENPNRASHPIAYSSCKRGDVAARGCCGHRRRWRRTCSSCGWHRTRAW